MNECDPDPHRLIGSPADIAWMRGLRDIDAAECDRIGFTEAYIAECERVYANIVRGGQGHPDAEVEQSGLVVGLVLIGLLAFAAGLLLGWATTRGA